MPSQLDQDSRKVNTESLGPRTLSTEATQNSTSSRKGQFVKAMADKIASTGNENILLCERGTFFGYGALVNDFRSIPIIPKLIQQQGGG